MAASHGISPVQIPFLLPPPWSNEPCWRHQQSAFCLDAYQQAEGQGYLEESLRQTADAAAGLLFISMHASFPLVSRDSRTSRWSNGLTSEWLRMSMVLNGICSIGCSCHLLVGQLGGPRLGHRGEGTSLDAEGLGKDGVHVCCVKDEGRELSMHL